MSHLGTLDVNDATLSLDILLSSTPEFGSWAIVSTQWIFIDCRLTLGCLYVFRYSGREQRNIVIGCTVIECFWIQQLTGILDSTCHVYHVSVTISTSCKREHEFIADRPDLYEYSSRVWVKEQMVLVGYLLTLQMNQELMKEIMVEMITKVQYKCGTKCSLILWNWPWAWSPFWSALISMANQW